MIVTCEECSTQFYLDEAKIPKRGVKARCSRCKHAFLVVPPGRKASDRISDMVESALENSLNSATPSAPEPTQDLDSPQPPQDPEPAAAPEEGGEGESDWQFNDDSSSDAAPEAADEAGDPAEDSLSQGRSAFGAQAPDFSSPEAGVAGDLGSPESWDLVSSAASEGPSAEALGGPGAEAPPDAVAPEPTSQTADARSELFEAPAASPDLAAPPEPAELPEPAAPSSSFEPEPVAEVPELATPQPAAPSPAASVRAPVAAFDADAELASPGARRAVSAVGWACTLALFLAGLYGGLVAPRSGAEASSPSLAIGQLEVDGVEGRWIENAVAGTIYVVSGQLRNPGPGIARPDAILSVRLLDEAGEPLAGEAPAVGPALPAADLRELDPWVLRDRQEQGAGVLAHVPLAPGAGLPVHAILLEVPAAAARFQLEVSPAPAPEPVLRLAEDGEAASSP